MNKSKVKNILFINLTNIGDCILTLPVLSVLRAEIPEAKIDMVCGKAPFSLFQGCQDLRHVFVYDKNWPLLKKWFWIMEVSKNKYDLIVDLKNTMIPLMIWTRYRTSLIRTKIKKGQSVREKHLSLLKRFKLDLNHKKRIQLYSDNDVQYVQEKFKKFNWDLKKPYAVVAPGANSTLKRWSEKSFLNIVQYLILDQKLPVVLLGGVEEQKLSQFFMLQSSTPSQLMDMIGKTTLNQAACFLSKASIVVANDSALMQMAQEMGVNTVSLFGPTNPLKYAGKTESNHVVQLDLDCIPCEKASCMKERRECLDDLKVDQVIQGIEQVLC